jgi:peptidoglycan hydrolase FlgJ
MIPIQKAPILPSPWTAAPAPVAKAEKSAREFEAMAIGQMLQPMFATVDSAHSLFGGGAAEETWKPMLVTEIARKIAANGGFGLARPVLAEMLRMQEGRNMDTPKRKLQ